MEFIKHCSKCNYAVSLGVDAVNFFCLTCDENQCPRCDKGAHPGLSCQKYAVILQKKRDESNPIGSSDNLVICPKCDMLCELKEGCHFLTCPSKFCLNNTHFCNLCGK